MARSYDKERLIEKIMNVYDYDLSDHDKYEELQKLVDDDIDSLKIKKTQLEELVASLQDDYLLITYDVTTNIVDQGHDGDGTLYIDVRFSIEDVTLFAKWLQNTVKNPKSIDNQNDIENFVRGYLSKHKVKSYEIGLCIANYDVN